MKQATYEASFLYPIKSEGAITEQFRSFQVRANEKFLPLRDCAGVPKKVLEKPLRGQHAPKG